MDLSTQLTVRFLNYEPVDEALDERMRRIAQDADKIPEDAMSLERESGVLTIENQANLPESSPEDSAVERRDMLTKLVAAAAFAATGLIAGGADAESDKTASAIKTDKTDKWIEVTKIYKDSVFKYLKMRTGFRVEIQAPAELATTLRSMGLVPHAEGGTVKLSIEFSNA